MQQNQGMEKGQFINVLIFAIIMMGLMVYLQNRQQGRDKSAQETVVKDTEQVQQKIISVQKPNDSPVKSVKLSNKELSLELVGKGGQISSVQLKDYDAYDKNNKNKNLYLFRGDNAEYGFQFKDASGKIINTKDLHFTPSIKGNTVTMQSQIGEASIQFIYTLLPKYTVNFKVRTQGLSQYVSDSKATFIWDYKVREVEKGRSQEQAHTEFVYTFDNYKSYDYDGRGEMSEPEETLNWIGVKQQFFAAVIESQSGFLNSEGSQESLDKKEFLKSFNYNGDIAVNGGEFNQDFSWYFMPLELEFLESFNKNFEHILPLGWSFIRGFNTWFFIPIYELISRYVPSAGWAIALLTIIVKILLSPIMFRQHKLSAMMKVVRPEVEAVNAKYKNADPMKRQQEVMSVYRKAGVNQLAGCLPSLLQIPIFYALFRFFPNYIDFRGKSFWFVEDLSSFDDVIRLPFRIPALGSHLSIFALSCTIVILIYTMMTSGNMQRQEGMPNMKPLMYIFPITFIFFLNSAASGLSWYYFVSNALNIVIILVITNFILDEKKIHTLIQENKAKPIKEGRFAKKIREMMEKAREQQKLQQQHKRK